MERALKPYDKQKIRSLLAQINEYDIITYHL